jgi:hypothetical protein
MGASYDTAIARKEMLKKTDAEGYQQQQQNDNIRRFCRCHYPTPPNPSAGHPQSQGLDA